MITAALLSAAPLVPDPDEARKWAERELAKPGYAEAQPNAIDRIAAAVRDFFVGLFDVGPVGSNGWVAALIAVLVIALAVAAFLIWGRPRALHRGRARAEDLFGPDTATSASQLRAEATERAAAEDWIAAIVLRFRALARALAERTVVDTAPGVTVHGFARAASRAFPDEAESLEAAASAFDDVRYLRRPGTPELYARVVALDERLARARPIAHAGADGLVGAPR